MEITLLDIAIFLVGLSLFMVWLVKTSFGRKALLNTPPRLNNMPTWLPVVPLFLWVVGLWFAKIIIERFAPDFEDWQKALFDNVLLSAGSVAVIAIIIYIVKRTFTEQLKGFGLNPKTILKDLFAAVVNLLAISPFVTLAIVLTLFLGRLVAGPQFEIQKHQELEQIAAHSQVSVRVMVAVLALAIAPLFEEMLFRGLFQTMLRTYLLNPWPAIALAAGLFAVIHPDMTHWPALFIIAACMGYAYEKSGSLFRPIFIHAIFNAIGILSALQNA